MAKSKPATRKSPAPAPTPVRRNRTPADQIVLQASGIVKNFPGVLANDHVDFDLRRGEIHALLGENGAGKTTLMNILYGLYAPDAGEIRINGEPIQIASPRDAIQRGIGMVHQHFMLVPVFTVAENIMLGDEEGHQPKHRLPVWARYLIGLGLTTIATALVWNLANMWLGLFTAVVGAILTHGFVTRLDREGVARRIRALSHQYGLEVDPHALVGQLPVGLQQRVEIVKALYRQANILILDEPTAVLTPQEAEELFRIMRDLTARGVSIIFITHKLKEVLAVADRITVMRAGRVVGTVTPRETSEARLAAMMVGREVILKVKKEPARPKEEVLRVENLRVHDQRGLETVRGVSFSVRAGEILGIAGVQGNGQTELVEALTGLRHAHAGHVYLDGQNLTNRPPRRITEAGVAHIPEDRQRHGLVLAHPVADNLILCSYYLPPFGVRGVLQQDAIDKNAHRLVQEFDVRTPSAYVPASKLSGGNQQKVIVARELSRQGRLLIANQPTRGLDVGSIEYIHSEIVAMRDRGMAVLLVSAELDEIMALSDRIAVMYRGEIVAVVEAASATREKLGLWMAGGHPES